MEIKSKTYLSLSIYGFRDTSPYYIINIDKVLGCKVDDINMVENHRSTPQIIEMANKEIARNKNRIVKELVATRPDGEPVIVKGFLTSDEERKYVVEQIAARIKGGTKPEDIAVLARNKSELNKMADLLAKEGIPSVIQFPEKVVEDSRVMACFAMLRAIKDSDARSDLLAYANGIAGGTLKNADEDELEKAVEEAMIRIKAYRAVTDEEEKKEALKEMLDEMDPDKMDSIYQSFCETLLLRNSEKVFTYAEDFETFGGNQAMRRVGNYPGVVLSTAHSSKGLEWPIVFAMIGGYDSPELQGITRLKIERTEEERRLLFVSITRARDVLYITSQYTCGGKLGDYYYNRFLAECLRNIGEDYSTEAIEQERHEKKKEADRKKREEKKKKAKAEALETAEAFNKMLA